MKLPKPKYRKVEFIVNYMTPVSIPVNDRLLEYVGERIKVIGTCWVWQQVNANIGVYLQRGKQVTIGVHPLMYKIYNGPLEKRALLDRRCLNRMCINPEHLSIGSYKARKRSEWIDRGAPPEDLDITETSSLGLGSTLDPNRCFRLREVG